MNELAQGESSDPNDSGGNVMAPNHDIIVELQGISKRFPGVIANEDINIQIRKGEIHAVCGENGAGKSTLMKIIYGMQQPDEGAILINGAPANFHSPRQAIEAGIGMVHQHFMLAGYLSVYENIILGSEGDFFPSLKKFRRAWKQKVSDANRSDARDRIRELCATYSLNIDPNQSLDTLEVGQRQKVEIIKALYRGAEILILDEPTAVLVPQEVEELFETMRAITAQGRTILFIDHKLDEVLEIADRISVIRQGRMVATVDKTEVTSGDLAELMIGSELPTPEIFEDVMSDEILFEAKSITLLADQAGGGAGGDDLGTDAETDDGTTDAAPAAKALLNNVSFAIRRGEIVGVAGVEGNGQAELIQVLLGLREAQSGSLHMRGQDITDWPTRRRREFKLGYIPEDRHEQGLLLSSPLWNNTMLGYQGALPHSSQGFWLRPNSSKNVCEEVVEQYDVRTPSIFVAADALSGGNQQKLIIGREMITGPEVLLAAHPTRGIDIGAQESVWEKLRQARQQGLAVLLISADLDELIGLSDRLLVILRGEIVAELDPSEVNPRELGSYMTGAKQEPAGVGR